MLSADEKLVAAARHQRKPERQEILVWDVASAKQLHAFPSTYLSDSTIAISRDSRTLAYGLFEGKVRWYDLTTGKMMREVTSRAGPVTAVAISPNGETIIAGGHGKPVIYAWAAATGRPRRPFVLREPANVVRSLVLSPDGSRLALAQLQGPLRIWDTATRKVVKTYRGLQPHSYSAPAFSPDGRLLAVTLGKIPSIASLGLVVVDLKTDRISPPLEYRGRDFEHPAFAPDGRRLAVTRSSRVLLFDIECGRPLRTDWASCGAGGFGGLRFTGGGTRLTVLWPISGMRLVDYIVD